MRFFLLLLLASLTNSHAASMTFVSDAGTYSIGIPGEFSECRADEDRAICKDGQFFIAVGPNGCEDSIGLGYCSQIEIEQGVVANELYCENGSAFRISTGPHAARCKTDSSGKHCTSLDGEHTASASCTNGCGDTSGAGGCQKVQSRKSTVRRQ